MKNVMKSSGKLAKSRPDKKNMEIYLRLIKIFEL